MSDRVHLPVVNNAVAATKVDPVRTRRHPEWIKAQLPSKPAFFELKQMVKDLKLHTVCESASCPNIGECWTRRALTIMIMGDICTRSCRFCDVTTGRPQPLDTDEPRRVAEMLSKLHLEHTVITCVDRDDLAAAGANAFQDRNAAHLLQDEHAGDARDRDTAEDHDDQADEAQVVLGALEVAADLIFRRAVRPNVDELVAQVAA